MDYLLLSLYLNLYFLVTRLHCRWGTEPPKGIVAERITENRGGDRLQPVDVADVSDRALRQLWCCAVFNKPPPLTACVFPTLAGLVRYFTHIHTTSSRPQVTYIQITYRSFAMKFSTTHVAVLAAVASVASARPATFSPDVGLQARGTPETTTTHNSHAAARRVSEDLISNYSSR